MIPFLRREEFFSIENFLRAVDRKRYEQAIHIIAEVFLLGDSLALETLGRFLERSRENPTLKYQLRELRRLIIEREAEKVYQILEACFGIKGMDALWVFQAYQQSLVSKKAPPS